MTLTPCISLHQPYASLLFVANMELRKQHETRSFPFPDRLLGQRIAIHAAKKPVRRAAMSFELSRLCFHAFGPGYDHTLPLGAVIGTIVVCQWIVSECAIPLSNADRVAGDFGPNRFAWLIEEPQLLTEPLPAVGRQRWFNVELPDAR